MSYIIHSFAVTTAASNGRKTMEISEVKGQIWDCNMNPLVDITPRYFAAILPQDEGIDFVNLHCNAQQAAEIKESLMKGKPVCEPLNGYAKGNNAVKIIKTFERYSGNQLCSHIIGYTDSSGNGVCGLEKSFQDLLSENSYSVSVSFDVNGRGQSMSGDGIQVRNENTVQKSGVILTIDKMIQQIAETVMDNNQISCGAVVISDVTTGDIKAIASRPAYNPNKIADSLKNPDSPFINRALLPFTVGSVFKPVIAVAALEYGIDPNLYFDCSGRLDVNGVCFHCHNVKGHNKLNLKSAIAQSCNLYFIQLASSIPKNVILDIAKDFGFGESAILAEGIVSSAGNLPTENDLDSDAAKANFSFGQGTLLATPLQINTMTACIANGGICHTPRLIIGKTDSNGNITYYPKSDEKQVIKESTADFLREAMRAVVTEGTGKRADTNTVDAAGKTATAQTGQFIDNKEQHNAWFTGFFPYQNPRYAVTVFIENGGEGALSAAPVFKQILEAITTI